MAAVIVPSNLHPAPRPARSPERARPTFRVIHGGRSPAGRAAQRVFWRRRLLAVFALVIVAGVVALAIVGVRSLVGSAPATPQTSAATAAVPPAAAEAYLVQPGDTLWSIAEQLHPDGDVRAVVDELADRAGGPVLQTGQRIDVHGLTG